uniref:Uncharacterized protein n=1 Tax=Timema monikensis TaxID=170555 RepID=A0A7R9ECW2_9NEOP|nr:unnamed protein product [Timema monikensis]
MLCDGSGKYSLEETGESRFQCFSQQIYQHEDTRQINSEETVLAFNLFILPSSLDLGGLEELSTNLLHVFVCVRVPTVSWGNDARAVAKSTGSMLCLQHWSTAFLAFFLLPPPTQSSTGQRVYWRETLTGRDAKMRFQSLEQNICSGDVIAGRQNKHVSLSAAARAERNAGPRISQRFAACEPRVGPLNLCTISECLGGRGLYYLPGVWEGGDCTISECLGGRLEPVKLRRCHIAIAPGQQGMTRDNLARGGVVFICFFRIDLLCHLDSKVGRLVAMTTIERQMTGCHGNTGLVGSSPGFELTWRSGWVSSDLYSPPGEVAGSLVTSTLLLVKWLGL